MLQAWHLGASYLRGVLSYIKPSILVFYLCLYVVLQVEPSLIHAKHIFYHWNISPALKKLFLKEQLLLLLVFSRWVYHELVSVGSKQGAHHPAYPSYLSHDAKAMSPPLFVGTLVSGPCWVELVLSDQQQLVGLRALVNSWVKCDLTHGSFELETVPLKKQLPGRNQHFTQSPTWK